MGRISIKIGMIICGVIMSLSTINGVVYADSYNSIVSACKRLGVTVCS